MSGFSKRFNSSWIERDVYYRQKPDSDPPHYERYLRPVIVCLCGSTRFKESWWAETKRLTHEGKIVLGVGDLDPNHPDTNVPIDIELKARLDELHKRKIDLADEVFVLNVGGYIGESTRSEIEYAKSHDKPIQYLEPTDDTENVRAVN